MPAACVPVQKQEDVPVEGVHRFAAPEACRRTGPEGRVAAHDGAPGTLAPAGSRTGCSGSFCTSAERDAAQLVPGWL